MTSTQTRPFPCKYAVTYDKCEIRTEHGHVFHWTSEAEFMAILSEVDPNSAASYAAAQRDAIVRGFRTEPFPEEAA